MSDHHDAEGWYQDPFGVHEERWISEGTPTKLVRDGEVECYDPPPDAVAEGELVESVAPPPHPGDLQRADAAQQESEFEERDEREKRKENISSYGTII